MKEAAGRTSRAPPPLFPELADETLGGGTHHSIEFTVPLPSELNSTSGCPR